MSRRVCGRGHWGKPRESVRRSYVTKAGAVWRAKLERCSRVRVGVMSGIFGVAKSGVLDTFGPIEPLGCLSVFCDRVQHL